MTEPDRDHRHAVALFRYGLIADLVRIPPGTPGLYPRIAEKAQADYQIPGTSRTRVAAETIRHWLKRFRAGGFDALMPKPRADRGRPRKIPDDVAEQLVALKAQHPRLSVTALVRHARSAGHIPDEIDIAPSTVHRLLTRAGLMRKRPEDPTTLDRRRFTYQRAGELWMSDVMHGPSVVVEGKVKRKSYLIAFLDDATRVIPYATFALAESTQAFLPVFKQALMRRGLAERLYVVRRELPLASPRARVRQAWHRTHPCKTVPALCRGLGYVECLWRRTNSVGPALELAAHNYDPCSNAIRASLAWNLPWRR